MMYRADLHVHTVLSPCGDLEMSPANIVKRAKEKGIDILGITDHNSTKHCKLIKELGEKEGILVMMGAEVTTKEEAHCLAFFETLDNLNEFQAYLEKHLPEIPNDVDKFGHQVIVDEQENIIGEEKWLLITTLTQSIDDIEKEVHRLGGIFIPAHVNRAVYSVISQLGFIPKGLEVDALEISKHTTKEAYLKEMPFLSGYSFIHSSDAHFINDLGVVTTEFEIEELSFNEVKMALKNQNGRKVNVR